MSKIYFSDSHYISYIYLSDSMYYYNLKFYQILYINIYRKKLFSISNTHVITTYTVYIIILLKSHD